MLSRPQSTWMLLQDVGVTGSHRLTSDRALHMPGQREEWRGGEHISLYNQNIKNLHSCLGFSWKIQSLPPRLTPYPKIKLPQTKNQLLHSIHISVCELMKFKSHLKPPRIYGDFLLNPKSTRNEDKNTLTKCEQKRTFLTHSRWLVLWAGPGDVNPAYTISESAGSTRSHRSLQKDLCHLLSRALWYVVNNSTVFKGVSRDLWKAAARNVVVVSTWSKQPRPSAVQGHCWICQEGAGKWTGRGAAAWTSILYIPSQVVFLLGSETFQILNTWPQSLWRILNKSFLFSDIKNVIGEMLRCYSLPAIW